MVRKKKAEVGNHLAVLADGTLKWDWDKLLEEVKEATSLVKVTETKVKKARKKKTD